MLQTDQIVSLTINFNVHTLKYIIMNRKHLIVQRVFRWETVKVMMNSEVTVNFVNLSWLSKFALKSVWELGLQICALDRRTIILKHESKVCTFDIIIEQLALTKLFIIAAPCVNYDMILKTSWLHAVNSDIDWKLWTITLQITQKPPLGFIEKLLKASVHLAESTSEVSVNDHLKLTQALMMTSLSSSVHDHLKTHSDLVKIFSKMLKDSEDYVLDLDAVNYADYLDDEFFFLMYSHCLTEEKVIFAVTSVFFNISKPLVTDEDWVISEVYQEFTEVVFKSKVKTLLKFRGL